MSNCSFDSNHGPLLPPKEFYPSCYTKMEELTTNSRSTFSCSHVPFFSWDVNISAFHWFIDAIALIASPCTILLNAMVILVMKQSKEIQKTSYILLSSLAVTDLLIGVIVMPLSATTDFLIFRQVSPEYICMLDLVNFFFMFLLFSATLGHLTVIAWERYVAIQKWMDYKVIFRNGRLKKLAVAAWLSTLLPAVPYFIMTVVDVNHRMLEGWLTLLSAMGAVCLTLTTFFYIKVYLGIRKRKINEISQVNVQMKAKLESKVAKTTGVLTAALIFSFIPTFVVAILGNFLPFFRTSVAFRFTDTVTQLNSLFNPLLYSYRERRFRNAIRELLGMKKTQAVKQAVGAAPVVRRKDLVGTTNKLHKVEKPAPRLTRSASCNPLVVSDSVHQRPHEVTLKRSRSAPMLDKYSSSLNGLRLQQSSSIMTTRVTIHAESGVQPQARKNNTEYPKDDEKPQVTFHFIKNKSRSKSWDFTASVKTQDPEERPNSAPDSMVPDEAPTATGFTTRL